jgi:hypothetical protein
MRFLGNPEDHNSLLVDRADLALRHLKMAAHPGVLR